MGEYTIFLLRLFAWSIAAVLNVQVISAYDELLQKHRYQAFHPYGSLVDEDDAYIVLVHGAALVLVALERRQRGVFIRPIFLYRRSLSATEIIPVLPHKCSMLNPARIA